MESYICPHIRTWIRILVCHIYLWTIASACVDLGITKVWNMTELYNPQTELIKCGRRGKASWVCDPGKILCEKEGDRIDDFINEISSETGCPCGTCPPDKQGYKFAVAVVPKVLDGEDTAAMAEVGRAWTEYFQNITNFGICGEEIVIVWSAADHVVWTLTGSTVTQQYLYEKCMNNIIHASEGYRCSGDPAKGILWILGEIRHVFNGLRCNFLDYIWVKIVLPTGVAVVLYIIALACYAYHNWSEKRQKLQRRRDGIA